MTRTRSMLLLSLFLLLVGSVLMEPDLLPDRARGAIVSAAVAAPGSSASASLIEPGTTSPNVPEPTWQESPRRLDLRGNEITRPVARYRVDERGSLYEVHSPDTEVPRLEAPIM